MESAYLSEGVEVEKVSSSIQEFDRRMLVSRSDGIESDRMSYVQSKWFAAGAASCNECVKQY